MNNNELLPAQTTSEELTLDLVDPRRITIKGARVNNLKNIDLEIPKKKLVVVTGVSGSGKSSITMDTLYAEGQRRYVESLSSYARQFLGRMKKPDVDYIRGICPAIAIEQRVTSGNARSTVGSMTELYDFLRLLFARIGRYYSPKSSQLVQKHEVSDVVDFVKHLPAGSRGLLLSPVSTHGRAPREVLFALLQKGYTRVYRNERVERIEDLLEVPLQTLSNTHLLIDRFVRNPDEENDEMWMRFADSVYTALSEGEGKCFVVTYPREEAAPQVQTFSTRLEADGIIFPEITPQLFNYNNPYGACPTCEGYGRVLGIDPDKVIPDKSKSVYEGAIAPWRGERFGEWLTEFLRIAHTFDFPVHKPYEALSKEQQKLLWNGNEVFPGIRGFFEELESKTYKIQNRIMLARYRGRTVCPTCEGQRLRWEALCVRIKGKNIAELAAMPIEEVAAFFESAPWSSYEERVARRLLWEIQNRLRTMIDLGLGYLSLDRVSNTLSGGETQRIHLTRALGSNLVESMYLLDEPSVGLHPRDTARLVQVLKRLRDLGNTVVVVEHEEEIIRNADFLIDMGPEAGIHGGKVVYAGPYADLERVAPHSLTAQYLSGRMQIPIPEQRRLPQDFLIIKGARQHNLKRINVRIPLGCLVVVSGVSGSGKTTLVRDILYPALMQHLPETTPIPPGFYDGLEGAVSKIRRVEMVTQSPIGKSSRSNPVTYVKAYDAIRDLFAAQPLSKIRGYQPRHFSFNVEGGRCEVCKGEGEQVIEMQFLADVHLECEGCRGRRFQADILEVEYRGKNIYDVLTMTVDEALEFFKGHRDIVDRLKPLSDVGLGYVQLGQPSSTLSGGEAQRVKLASFLLGNGQSNGSIFFIFDEPTTGLHFHDIRKLLTAFDALVNQGHTVLVVEHNLEVIKCADWVIDLGPEGGKNGGYLLFEGPPEELIHVKESHTANFLRQKLHSS
ncbi:MAG: excinuclease ABC subunit UvrA [Saprospiraceae bacterium]|nr:excinuclease ABC subunit UvrA [Saprospiraceae bacterium]MDW8484948.1 excinuclease ABC subunit UvrA [Saprospiraceae bacterium]